MSTTRDSSLSRSQNTRISYTSSFVNDTISGLFSFHFCALNDSNAHCECVDSVQDITYYTFFYANVPAIRYLIGIR